MKITINDKHCKIIAENPDDRFNEFFQSILRDCIAKEIAEFFEEISVRLRHLKLGETVSLESKPIHVEISGERSATSSRTLKSP